LTVTDRIEAAPAPPKLGVDLLEEGLLPPLPSAFLEGRDHDLLAPLRWLPTDGELPEALVSPASARGPVAGRPDRAPLAEALARANRSYGHPGADRLAGLLADPATAVVATGQQPGLLGGPLYTLTKMIAAVRWARAIEAAGRAGRPAVAVFWIATEDHDWDEVSRAGFLAPDGLRTFRLSEAGEDPDPLLPVGMRTLGPGMKAVLEGLGELRSSDRFDDWLTTLTRIWRPDARFGEAFARWAVELLGEDCPLLLDSMDPGVKRAEAPWLARLVEERAAWEEASTAADAAIEERGHPLQVQPQRGASPLFVLRDGERRRIEWRGDDRYALRGTDAERPVADLLEALAENPGVVSPGVLARPAIQDAILGTDVLLLGPGEASYIAQAAATYRVLGFDPGPWVALRPQALILESHHREKLEELGVPLAALLGSDEALERRLAGENGAGFVARARADVEAALEALRGAAVELDPNLERPAEKTRENVLRALETFEGKATAAAARRDEVRHGRIEKLRAVILPGGTLQERAVCSSHFPGKYGDRLVEAIREQMELDGRRLQVVQP
jgi:bacillithiol biosynthesis cysteine-adding enzyme BshC